MAKLTTEEFIKKAQTVHGDRYDYSQVEYIDSTTKVNIICKEHGVFLQRPDKHLSGQGCPNCSGSIKLTTESFIVEAKEIYGDRYDYSKVDYKNREHRVTIICPIHGDFQVYAREHLDGKGCPKCEKGEKFLAKLKEKFGDKFGLDEFVYESSTSPVTLICPTYGAFSRLPNQILNYSHGCPECGNDYSRQLQEAARQDAIEHKEERDQARRERQRARNEAKRIAEEEAAKDKWNKRIQKIISISDDEVDDECMQIFDDCSHGTWQDDFFGFNLKSFRLDENSPILVGNIHEFFKRSHYPIAELKAEASLGELTQATFYFQQLDEILLFEVLLVIEHILSYGFINSIEMIKVKYESAKDYNFNVDGVRDGYKFFFKYKRGYASLNIRKIGLNALRTRRHYDYSRLRDLPKSFVGIDFETLYPQRVSACSVGMVKYKEGEIVDRYYTLIRPPFDYPGKCGKALTWIHGLTEEMVKDARTFAVILPEMERFIEGLPLVAHNACVEKACIRDASAYYGMDTTIDYENIYDTLDLSRRAEAKLGISEEGPGLHQLDTVCQRFGISGNNHHNAMADAEMCGNLMVIFQKILCEGESVEVVETSSGSQKKYNPEDKIQRIDLDNVADNPFKNQIVVLTGFAKTDSQEYAHKLNELGAIIKEGVNKKTNILITGYNAGPSKMQKAQEFGARIMSEDEFKEIIKGL